MANVGHIEIEVKPTVTLESAVACVTMLNLFLDDNEEYRVEVGYDGRCRITEKEILADMPALKNLAQMAGMETE